MPGYVLKADPDHDLYCVWSTIAEGPTFIGTRDAVRDHLLGEEPWIGDRAKIERRLERANATGTSAIPGFYAWSDDPRDGLIVDQTWWLNRNKLLPVLQELMEHEDDEVNEEHYREVMATYGKPLSDEDENE